MDTISFKTAAAAVSGARHRRAERNGQDAVCVLVDGGAAVAVVCDGCSSGAGSEVGARLGARWFAQLVIDGLRTGSVMERGLWDHARGQLVERLQPLVGGTVIDAERVREVALFTVVAAAVTRDGAAVFAIGDGAYAVDGTLRVLGPFPDNEPPYLAYDLLGTPGDATFETFARARRIVVATDGIDDLGCDIGLFGGPALLAHPDALRRTLVTLARGGERIDWDERRVIRTPARLQDDLAVAIVEVVS